MNRRERILGALWGAAIGDALGVPVEFKDRATVQADPVKDFRGFGTHHQPPGTWSDDTSLTLCTVESLIEREFDLDDLGRRFASWIRDDHWTPHGDVFDAGVTTVDALRRIERGTRAELAGGADEYSNGNGSLMRILPVALRFADEAAPQLLERARRVSAITHAHARSQMCCGFYCLLVNGLLIGLPSTEASSKALDLFREHHDREPWNAQFLNLRRLLDGSFLTRPESEIVSSGYVVHTLEAAAWCLHNTRSFEECVLKAVNLGGDSDTTGCVAGGLAGARYGLNAIPKHWRDGLARRDDLARLFERFVGICPATLTNSPTTDSQT